MKFSNPIKSSQLKPEEPRPEEYKLVGIRKGHPKREQAQWYVQNKEWDTQIWMEVWKLFVEYILDIAKKVIVLRSKLEPIKHLVIRYSSRFKKREIRKARMKFMNIMSYYASKYEVAVFLTITANPEDTIQEAYRKLQKAINKLKALLRKRYGKLVEHIAVVEPTKKGKPHIHMILFGIGRVEDWRELSKRLESYGIGKILYIRKLSKAKGRWMLEGRSIGHLTKYMIKYLNKNIAKMSKTLAWYWALNAKFYTNSRTQGVEQGKKGKQKQGEWEFIGVFIIEQVKQQVAIGVMELVNPDTLEEVESELEEIVRLVGPPENEGRK